MKQFGKILKFELAGYLKNKAFVGITLFLVAAIAAAMFIPNIIGIFRDDGEAEPDSTGEKPLMLVWSKDENIAKSTAENFGLAFPDYDVSVYDGTLSGVKKEITSGGAECAFEMTGATSYNYYVDNLSMYDSNTEIADTALREAYRLELMLRSGMSEEAAAQVLSASAEGNVIALGKDQMQNFFYTYIMIFALYMVILLYGQMVATNVATEKSSRAMELLITSAKPTSLMFGKVTASCVAGFLQLAAVFGSALVFYNIKKSAWGENMIIKSIFDIPVGLFVYMLVFFLLGFLIYAFLYGAIGSTASKLEDINTSVMPITFLFIIAFIVVIMAMTSGSVDSALMKICSFVPFTSPMAMFTRICMSTVPAYQIAISIAILIVSTVGVGFVSAKIYRVGVLLYGTPPKLGAIIKAIKKA